MHRAIFYLTDFTSESVGEGFGWSQKELVGVFCDEIFDHLPGSAVLDLLWRVFLEVGGRLDDRALEAMIEC